MSTRVRVETKLKVRPVSKVELRAQSAAEWCVNLGASEEEGRIASRGVLRRAWKEIRIEGLHPKTGRICDRAVYRIAWTDDHNEAVHIEDDDGISMLERLDGGLAALVRRTAERFQRKGLVIDAVFVFADHVPEDQKDDLRRELGVTTIPDRAWADGLEPRRVASLKPAKDTGSSFDIWWGRRSGDRS